METSPPGPARETIDTPRHRALGSASRVAILRLVRATTDGVTAAEIAEEVGLHLSTTRAHLDRLVDARLLVKARASGGQPGRPAWRYRAVADDPTSTPYRALASALLDNLTHPEEGARERVLEAGRSWGEQLAAEAAADVDADPTEAVVGVLDTLGFTPERQPAGTDARTVEVHLRTCPFLDLVGRHPDAMCGLHVGVVRGVLEHQGVPHDTTVLEPFGAPSACVVHVPVPPAAREDRP